MTEWSDQQINAVVDAYVCTSSDIGFQEDDFTMPIPIRPKHKHVPYGPASKPLVKAVRKELQRLLDAPDLDLGRLGHMALQAEDLLAFTSTPEDVMRGKQTSSGMEPNVGLSAMSSSAETYGATIMSSSAETYGATIIRELMPALKSLTQSKNETPEQLVFAIATARREGMTDLAAELETKLVGKRLDGQRQANGNIVRDKAKKGKKSALNGAPHAAVQS